MPATGDDAVWAVRTFVYQRLADTTRPPTVEEAAAHFGIGTDRATDLYRELHRRHALFLEPGTTSVRMANPFSGIPTPFRVHAKGKSYWANCAWDALGIPAALHCDATVETQCAGSGRPVTLAVNDRQVSHQGELIHFLVPFRRWYDDLVFT